MATLVSICLGLGLAAACGFRIFVPFLLLSVSSRAGYVTLGAEFEWIAGTPALISFAAATVLEIAAYYVPAVDNMLDIVATPAAIVAGAVITSSVVTGIDPGMKWTLVAIAGGSIAGALQLTTVAVRQASLIGTGGLGNPVVSSAEAAGAVTVSILAVLLPVVSVVLIVLGLFFVRYRRARRARMARASRA